MNARLRRNFGSLGERVRTATPRERLMLSALALVGTLILLSVGLRLTRTAVTKRNEVNLAGLRAAALLDGAPAIEKALADKAAKLAGKRIAPAELLAVVDNIAREGGLNFDAGAPRAEKTGKLTVYRFRVNLRAPSLQKLMEFDDSLRMNADGLIVERVSVDSRNDAELAATYELAACQPAE